MNSLQNVAKIICASRSTYLGMRRANEDRGQSYKASMLVNYDSLVVSISNLLVITTLES